MKKNDRNAKASRSKKLHHGTDEVKRYLGSLAEDFQGKVSAIGEQFSGLDQRFDHLEVKADRIDQKVDRIGQRLHHVEQKVDDIEQTMLVMQGDVAVIKSDIKKKVDYDEFQALARRVTSLGRKVH